MTRPPFGPAAEWIRRNGRVYAGRWCAIRAGALLDHDVCRQELTARLAGAGEFAAGVWIVRV